MISYHPLKSVSDTSFAGEADRPGDPNALAEPTFISNLLKTKKPEA